MATDYQCRCELVIEVYADTIIHGYTGKPIEAHCEEDGVTITIPDGITPYYVTPEAAYGFDAHGHDVEVRDGKVTRIYSQNQRKDAIADAREMGAAAASRKHDIPAETIRSWLGRRTAL